MSKDPSFVNSPHLGDVSDRYIDDIENDLLKYLKNDSLGGIYERWSKHELGQLTKRGYGAPVWGDAEQKMLSELRGINWDDLRGIADRFRAVAGTRQRHGDQVDSLKKSFDDPGFSGEVADAFKNRFSLKMNQGFDYSQIAESVARAFDEVIGRSEDIIKGFRGSSRGSAETLGGSLIGFVERSRFKKTYIEPQVTSTFSENGASASDYVPDVVEDMHADIDGIDELRGGYWNNADAHDSDPNPFGKYVAPHMRALLSAGKREGLEESDRIHGRSDSWDFFNEVTLPLKNLEKPGSVAATGQGAPPDFPHAALANAGEYQIWTPLRLFGSPGCRGGDFWYSFTKLPGAGGDWRGGTPAHERMSWLDGFCGVYDNDVRYLCSLVRYAHAAIGKLWDALTAVLNDPLRPNWEAFQPPRWEDTVLPRVNSGFAPASIQGQPQGAPPVHQGPPPPPDNDGDHVPADKDADDNDDKVQTQDQKNARDKAAEEAAAREAAEQEAAAKQRQQEEAVKAAAAAGKNPQNPQIPNVPSATDPSSAIAPPGAPPVNQQVPQPSTPVPAGQPGAINNPNLPGAVLPPQPLVPGQAPPAPKPLAPIEQRMGHEIKPIGNRADIRVADPDQQGTRSPERNHPLGDRQVVSLERKPVEGGKPGEFAHNEFILTVDKDGEGAEAPQKFLVSFPHDAPPPVDPNAAAQQPGQPQPEPGNEGQPAEGQPQVGPDGKPVAPAPQLGPDGKPVPLAPEQAWEGLRQATITPWDDQNQDNKVGQEELGQPVEKGKPLLVDLGNGYKEEISVNWDPEMGVNAAEPGPNGEPGDPNNPRIDQLNLQVKPVEGDGALPVDPNLMKTQGYTINFEGSPNQSGEMQSLTPEQGKQLAADSPSGVDSQALPGSQSSSALSTPGGQNWGASGNGATNSTYEPVGAGSGTGASTGTQPPNGPQLPGGGQASGGNQTTPPGPQPAAAQTSSAAASTSPQSAGGGGMMPPMAPPMGGMGGPQAAGQGGQSKYPIQGQIFDEEERHRYLHNPVLGDERERRSGSDRSTTRRDQRYGEDPDRPRNSELQRWDEPPRRW